MYLKKTLNYLKNKKGIIEVFGLGYIGFPLCVKLANTGFNVLGIDVDEKKLTRFNNCFLQESELNFENDFIELRKNKKIKFSKKTTRHRDPKIGIICVPTPFTKNFKGSDIFVKNVVKDFLNSCKKGDVIIIESSLEIGTTERIKKNIKAKGFTLGKDFGLCYCPERIDPQNKKWDIHNIPRIIFCSDDISYLISKKIYQKINNANLIRVSSPKVAEVVKSFENTFRLANVSLVNELALLCEALKIDVGEVIKAASTKPFGFKQFYTSAGAGGHCIPKDPLFLLNSAKKIGFNFMSIKSAITINEFIPKHIVESIDHFLTKQKLKKSVIVCGLSYKQDMDDMRDSPGFKILKEFTHKKIKVVGYDPFFKEQSYRNYLKENQIDGMKFTIIDNLCGEVISKYNCLCIVQHHKKLESRINKIYEKSLIPFIYDCQNQIKQISNSKTILKSFGNNLDHN